AECALLPASPQRAAGRAAAFDTTATTSGGAASLNVSGLEKRLAHLLGLGAIAYEIYQEHDTDAKDEYRFRVRRRSGPGVLLSSSTKDPSPDAALREPGGALHLPPAPAGPPGRPAPQG